MSESMVEEAINIKFENFIDTLEGEDILGKTRRVDEVLKSGVLTGNEGLGMVTMNKVQPDSKIKEKDGSVHDVIMLGSNSYLNLSKVSLKLPEEVLNAVKYILPSLLVILTVYVLDVPYSEVHTT